jgi:hypothetical protein
MYRLLKTLLLLPWLSACGPSFQPGGTSLDWSAAPRSGLSYDFNWRLSGDRQVAPLQVFDDGQQTWLHFAPGQTVPAIFIEYNGAEQPAPYRRREPYVIVRGKWPSLVMRGGSLQARADYLGMAARTLGRARDEAIPSRHTATSGHAVSSVDSRAGDGVSSAVRPSSGHGVSPTGLYRVSPGDENMRRALSRWAGVAGWTFQPEHWAVDVDIPLAGSADFSDDFKRSVRELLATTELGERPLQPCFYTNRVLRVVPLPQACDRTMVRAGAVS